MNPLVMLILIMLDAKILGSLPKATFFMVAGGPISWECKRQDIVVLSTVEAEFMAFSKATTQALWLLKYFDKIGLLLPKPLKIFTDNNGSISNSLNDKNH